MKSILLSIRPEWVKKILTGEKTVEIRKKFPKDYQGWVYIYCTKSEPTLEWFDKDKKVLGIMVAGERNYTYCLNGKIVARFWCDKVDAYLSKITKNEYSLIEKILFCLCYKENDGGAYHLYAKEMQELLAKSCLDMVKLVNYLFNNRIELHKNVDFRAIHISKIEIFDKPKKLSEFGIKTSPQNYCYIEGE